ncbi:uncharacterized protein LAJ45_00975 [Morchella importuna]|uniref:uncharacterized protein n=1 Tax=Morchella importuna TaxID=1174673 RepID=UPI001E8D1156|nr:uncharacterized protein LAJ45_00975 [Morchella importuna]KAH8154448.1 hypothetical protein LAJ45_00975 [Morchella importuna]
MNAFPRFRKDAPPTKRDDNTNDQEVNLDSGHVDYNGFPPLSRTYCDAGVWPAGEVLSNINSERNYTYRIPRVKRFHQDYSLPTTHAYENLKEIADMDRKARPILTIRNATPSDGTLSKSSTGGGEIPCGGISPYEHQGINNAQDGSLLMVQPVIFGRRSIDIHRAEFSAFLTGRSNMDTNIRSSSCPSCHGKSRADIIKNPDIYVDTPARPITTMEDPCDRPAEDTGVEVPLAHQKVNSGDYADVFGTFGSRDGFSAPEFCRPRANNITTRPRLEDIFPTTSGHRLTWAADAVVDQGPASSLPSETGHLNIPPSSKTSNSLNGRMSLISPDHTPPQRKGKNNNHNPGSDPLIETPVIKSHRLSWAANTTTKDCPVPTIIVEKPSSSSDADINSTTTGRYLFKLGSLKIGSGFAPNARAKSPYPRDLNNASPNGCPSGVTEETTPRSKWATFSKNSRRAYPYLMKARSSISLHRACASPASTEGLRPSPVVAVDPIEISVESFCGRSRRNPVTSLSMVDEFRRKNDLLAMETGYRIPERVGSPTRSAKIELYGDEFYDGNFIGRAKKRLSKLFRVGGSTD